MMEEILKSIKNNLSIHTKMFNKDTNKDMKEMEFEVKESQIKESSGSLNGEYTLYEPDYVDESGKGIDIIIFAKTFNFVKGVANFPDFKNNIPIKIKAKPQNVDVSIYINRDTIIEKLTKDSEETVSKNVKCMIGLRPSEAMELEPIKDTNDVLVINDLKSLSVIFVFPANSVDDEPNYNLEYVDLEDNLKSVISIIKVENGTMLTYSGTPFRGVIKKKYIVEFVFNYTTKLQFKKDLIETAGGMEVETEKPKATFL